MSPRRTRKNAHLAGTNLYYAGKYLYYQNPITGKRTYMTGKTEAEAIQLAHQANKQIPEQRKRYEIDHIPALIERFKKDYLPLKEYAPTTLKGVVTKLNKIATEFEGVQLKDITVITLRDHLEPYTPCSRKAVPRMKTARASEGRKAYTDGKLIDDCPYSPDEDWQGYIQWRTGYTSQKRDDRQKGGKNE